VNAPRTPTEVARAERLLHELERLRVPAHVEVLGPGRVAVACEDVRLVGDAIAMRAALRRLPDESREGDAWLALWRAADGR
jgi:hypothetical protein